MLLAHGIVVLIVLISLLQFSRGILMWTEHSAINPDCKDCICVVNRRNQVAREAVSHGQLQSENCCPASPRSSLKFPPIKAAVNGALSATSQCDDQNPQKF